MLTQKLPYYKRDKLLLSPHELAIILPQRKWIHLSDEASVLLRESEAMATRERRMRRAAIAAVVVILIAAIAAFAIQQNVAAERYETVANTAVAAQAEAEREATISLAGKLASDAGLAKNLGEVIQAYELAKKSYQTAHTFESRSALYTALSLPLPERIFSLNVDVVDIANFSPDGERMVTVGSDDVARIWDLKSGEELFQLTDPEAVSFAAFSPDGIRIVTATSAGTVGIWNAQNGDQILVFQAHENGINSAVFSPAGSLIVTASGDGTAAL